MKAFLYKVKGALALTLAMSMFCPQAFAAEALSAAEQGVQEPPAVEMTAEEVLADAIPQLTVEEALDRAKKYSASLKNLEDQMDYLKESDEKLYDRVGSVKIPSYEYRKWANDSMYTSVSQVFQLEQSIKTVKASQELTELGTEASVKGSFITIKLMEEGLELLEKTAELQKTAYNQGQVKHRLGMLSTYNLEQLRIAAEKANADVTNMEAQLEQQYITFNRSIGENADTRFEFVYDATFQPLEMTYDLDQYIRNSMNDDLVIEIQELTTESAKFASNYLSESGTNPLTMMKINTDQNELTYDQEKRALKEAKEDKELAIRNAYLTIKQLETDYEAALADLTKAQADYRVAQLSYQTGAVTKTAVEGAEMAVSAAENALTQLIYQHDLQVFMFENPSILPTTTSTSSSSAQ